MVIKTRVLVIGAGVSGLTTAWQLANAGFQPIIVADKPFEDTVSFVAGALWEWPPAVCGFHTDIDSLSRAKHWSQRSYERFKELSQAPQTGVAMLPSYFYFAYPVADSEFDRQKMQEIRGCVDGFDHDPAWISRNGINPDLELQDCYRFMAPVIHPEKYLTWIRNQLKDQSVPFETRSISGPLREQVELRERYDAEFVINCTGLGSHQITDDRLYPLRGALVRMQAKTRNSQLNAAHCITNDETKQQNMIYVLPRGKHLLLGGIAQPDQWETSLSLENSRDVRSILERCQHFMPSLKDLQICNETPVLVGLRPARKKNVRLEWESEQPIIHNYGHGGSGFSFSWGCAEEILRLLQERIGT